MNPPSFLQVPVRLRHQGAGLFERIAGLGMLCVRAKNLTAELVAIADPSGSVLRRPDRVLLPGLGLCLKPERLAGLHALRMASLPHGVGVLDFDFPDSPYPLSIALTEEFLPGSSFPAFVADHCQEELELEELFRWRAGLSEPFQPCSCCQAVAEERRARPDLHPLALILGDLVELRLPFLGRIAGKDFDFSRFITPGALSFEEGTITLNDVDGDAVLRIDPAYAYALWVLPVQVDGECRTTVRVYDNLGAMNLELSVAGAEFVVPWQQYCVSAPS